MNTFAVFRNAPWKACLFAVLAVLGLIGQSAKAQTQPIFPVATQVGLPVESTPLFLEPSPACAQLGIVVGFPIPVCNELWGRR